MTAKQAFFAGFHEAVIAVTIRHEINFSNEIKAFQR